MTYVIEGRGALVNEAGEETPLKAGDFALVNPEGLAKQPRRARDATRMKNMYRNKGDAPFKMICGVPKEFE